MMLEHTDYEQIGLRLHKALDICGQYERRVVITGRDTGVTSEEFGDYVMATVEDPGVEDHWNELVMSA